MIRLDATTKILQLIATDTADVMVSGSTKTATTYTGFSTPTAATASTQTISAAPGAGEVKDHDHIELVNTGAANTVTFQTYNSSGAVTTKQFKAVLATGDTVEYRHSEGWSVKDSTGAIKMTMPGYLPLSGGIVSGATTFQSTVATGALTVTGAATVSTTLGVTGDSTLTGDLAVNGGDLTTTASTFNLLAANATTVNAFGAASVALNIGNASAAAAFAGGISIPTGKSVTGTGSATVTGFASVSATALQANTASSTYALEIGSTGADVRARIQGNTAYGLVLSNTGAAGVWLGSSGTDTLQISKGDGTSLGTWGPTGLTIPGALTLTATASPTGTGAGAVGQIAWDTAYLYICTATNDWRRVALTDF